MKLVLGKSFPSEPPKAFFLTKIFHPNVASNGEICVNTLKKDWKPELGIKHILLVRVNVFSTAFSSSSQSTSQVESEMIPNFQLCVSMLLIVYTFLF